MGMNVGNKHSQHATIVLGENHKGKGVLKYSDADDFSGAIGIGATNKVGPKSVEHKPGKFISELRDTIGGTLSADDVAKIFEKLTVSSGKGAPDGINGLTLIGVTSDSFTIAIHNGHDKLDAPDTLTFEVGETWFVDNGFDSGANSGDTKSRFSVLEDGEGGLSQGPSGDVAPGNNYKNDLGKATAYLEAALDTDEERVQLLGLEDDNFTIQVDAKGGSLDTILFKGASAKTAIADLVSGVNLSNSKDEFVFVNSSEGGNVPGGTGGSLNFLDTTDGTFDVGGVLSKSDLKTVAETAAIRPNVNVIDQGDTLRIEVAANNGTTDIYVLNEPTFGNDLLTGGEYDFA